MSDILEPPFHESKNETSLDHHHEQIIWAIGGGKGGVGKSFITSNISICLALMGHKVVTIDLDLGGANLHTCLGASIPEKTLSDFLSKKVATVEELLTSTSVPNLKFISGAQDELGMANLRTIHKNKLISSLSTLDASFILFDLGAGTGSNTIDFFLSANQGILVVLPEPTSIENAYRFIKSVYLRKLKKVEEFLHLHPLINQVFNAKMDGQTLTPYEMVEKIYEIDPEKGSKIKQEITSFRPKLIMNQVRTQADIDIGHSMKTVSKRYFGLDIDYVGHVEYDHNVWQSVRKRKPLMLEFPESKTSAVLDRLTQKLLQEYKDKLRSI